MDEIVLLHLNNQQTVKNNIMKNLLLILLIAFFSVNLSSAQLQLGVKKKKEMSAKEILKRVKESEEKKAYQPKEVVSIYSPEEKAKTIEQIRNAKNMDELPVLKSIAYYPNIEVFGLVPFNNEITDERFMVWRNIRKLDVGDTITVYATYDFKKSKKSNLPGSIDDVTFKPYRNLAAKITDDMNEKTLFISGGSFSGAMSHFGDRDLWDIYEGRRDTILLKQEYKASLVN